MEKQNLETEFLDMLRNHNRIIYKVASFYTDENTSIDDLYQDVVLNLWKAFPNFRRESQFSTWIYRIALNTCVSFFRRSSKRPTFVKTMPEIKVETEENEAIAELYACINKLGKLERALILLYLEDRPYKEIADIMGITTTNVSTKINRIKDKLKQLSKN
ncbi:MAG: sigma-70 family RNA polymerase sigma factor [Bacteroidales bacterium]|nr:sigma-70 family RNA polymerase sigma factor [Bacteroidales bacterium]